LLDDCFESSKTALRTGGRTPKEPVTGGFARVNRRGSQNGQRTRLVSITEVSIHHFTTSSGISIPADYCSSGTIVETSP